MMHSYKWNKQQILMDFNIRDMASFEENVKIFNKNEKKEVNDFIVEQKYRYCNCSELYFVLILVPIEHRYKLKNIVIKGEIATNQIYDLLMKDYLYSEIWVCTNLLKIEESFSGRFCINSLKGANSHILEIIKDDTPRLIEKIECYQKKKDENQVEYYLYSRDYWGMRYNEYSEWSGGMCDEYIQICKAIESKRERIEQFYSYLEEIGIINLSLDFRYRNRKLEFIDWDTENDKRVIAYLIGN